MPPKRRPGPLSEVVRAVVFDLDGTLVHSAPDIHAAASRMLVAEGVAPLDLETIVSFVGNGVPTLVARVIAATGLDEASENHARLTSVMLGYYAEDPATLSRLYPGVPEVLARLASEGVRLGICTNKPEAPAREILKHFGIAQNFDVVIGGDTLTTRKPDPTMLTATYAALECETGVFVGDSEVDAETAQRAGCPFALFTEGYRKTPVSQIPHDAGFSAYDDFAAVLSVLQR